MALEIGWFQNYGFKYLLLVCWCCLSIVLFVQTFLFFNTSLEFFYIRKILGYSLCVSRAAAAVLSLNCAAILLPMCHTFTVVIQKLLRMCRFPVTIKFETKSFHIFIAYIIVSSSVTHVVAHIINAIRFYDNFDQTIIEANPFPVREKIALKVLFGTVPGITGLLLVLVLILLLTTSIKQIRKRFFNVFWYTHRLFAVFYLLLLIHGLQGPLRRQVNVDNHRPGCNIADADLLKKSPPYSDDKPNGFTKTHNAMWSLFNNTLSSTQSTKDSSSVWSPHETFATAAVSEVPFTLEPTKNIYGRNNVEFSTSNPNKELTVTTTEKRNETMDSSPTLFSTTEHINEETDSIPSSVITTKYIKQTTDSATVFNTPPIVASETIASITQSAAESPVTHLNSTNGVSETTDSPSSSSWSNQAFTRPILLNVTVGGENTNQNIANEDRSEQINITVAETSQNSIRSEDLNNNSNASLETENRIRNILCPEDPVFSHIDIEVWKWLCVPLFLYICDFVYRIVRRGHDVDVVQMNEISSDIIEIRLSKKHTHMRAGQYVLINCAKISSLEWHPFSVVQVASTDNGWTFSVYMKVSGDWTESVKEAMRSLNDTEAGITRYPSFKMDGPFSSLMEHVTSFKTSICVSGGIGVTPFLSHLSQLRMKKQDILEKFHFIVITRDADLITHCAKICQRALKETNKSHPNILCVHFFLTGANKHKVEDEYILQHLKCERPDFDSIFTNICNDNPIGTIGVFSCGPNSMNTAVRSQCLHKSNMHLKLSFNKELF